MSFSASHHLVQTVQLIIVRPPGVLLVSPVLRVGLVSTHGSLCKFLEVVCGSWSAFPTGKDCGDCSLPYGRSLHRGGQPAAVQGDVLVRSDFTFGFRADLRLHELLSVCTQVTHLVIKRPQFFHFKPGDYVYINIPVIAKYEWHPFTISSAPEQSGGLLPVSHTQKEAVPFTSPAHICLHLASGDSRSKQLLSTHISMTYQ